MRNAMMQAFANVNNLPPMMKAALRRADQRKANEKTTTTKLSYRTYQKLKSQGIVE